MRLLEEPTRMPVPDRRANEQPSAVSTPAAPGRVLLVDDDPRVLETFARILERVGYEVQGVVSGSAAVAALGRSSFDVVVTDIRMPGVDGIALLKAVRDRDAELPVVVVTGVPALETAIAAVEHGAVQYLLKPPPSGALETAAAKAVARHRLAPPPRQNL